MMCEVIKVHLGGKLFVSKISIHDGGCVPVQNTLLSKRGDD
jgi:hypothetical protein